MGTLNGKKAVVIAGSRGIGAASALALAQAGAEVLLTYHTSKAPAEDVVLKIQSLGGVASCYQLDATQEDQCRVFGEHARKTLERVDVLFNNAGDLVARRPLEEQDIDYIRKVLDVNVLTTILPTRFLLPLMPQGASIVNMSSIAARNGGGPGAATYAASKGATLSLTRGWAVELAPRGIRVNAVAPGVIDTDFHKRHSKPEFFDRIAKLTLTGGVGVSEDIARAVVYLAGEGSGFITGACIDINGGMVMP